MPTLTLLGRATVPALCASLLTACNAQQQPVAGNAPKAGDAPNGASAQLTAVPWPANPLAMPAAGAHRLTILSPTMLELELVTVKEPDPAPVPAWDFVGANFVTALPAAGDFAVSAGGKTVGIKSVGFKRRPLYAPLKKRDLRLGNWLYLELAEPLPAGAAVSIADRSGKYFPAGAKFEAGFDANRRSPVIHVSDSGFDPAWTKQAFAGYYVGTLGELPIDPAATFSLIDAAGKSVFQGKLRHRDDEGWAAKPYQKVVEADFTAFKTPGTYRLLIPGLGTSKSFRIESGAAGLLARTYALGLYNQRSGMAVELPYSRHTYAADHTAPVEVPTNDFAAVNRSLDNMSNNGERDKRFTAPRMKDVNSSLYPFVKSGKIDVSGGHHDAGDYSVYTTNSSQLISLLCFAADVFPGAGALDNLGIPESGDGKSDLLQEAKWEADYLVKMQDTDGGFFFLKYPKERAYEGDVLPDAGDPQIVFPKNTAATGAATASLAQMASSPRFKAQFPEAAAKYAAAAQRGWKFLEDAVAKYGKDGAYQKISHYGDFVGHDDELVWAAVEMYLLTGDKSIADKWLAKFDPTAPETKRWGWTRLFDCYGSAIRSYAFAAKSGRVKETALNPTVLKGCQTEIIAGAEDQVKRANASSYRTSFPVESKNYNASGWYFSSTNTFDLATGYSLEPRPAFLNALLTNFGFEWGANPQNVDFITGIGETRQRDTVDQYAQNDRRVLPPTGTPLGNIIGGFAWLDPYKKELGALTFPFDGDAKAPTPQMDRWGDSFNVTAEFVVSNQAAALGGATFLMGQTALKTQAWRTTAAKIAGAPQGLKVGQTATLTLVAPGLDSKQAQIVWEARGMEPFIGLQFTYKGTVPGPLWVEAEALWPDGRRVAAAVEFPVTPASGGLAAVKSAGTQALLNFDAASLADALQPYKAQVEGNPQVSAANIAWMEQPAGKALQLPTPAASVSVPVGAVPGDFTLSGRLYLERVIPGISNGGVLALGIANPNELIFGIAVNKYPNPWVPEIRIGDDLVINSAQLEKFIKFEQWQRWDFTLRGDRATVTVDGKTIYDDVVKNPTLLHNRGKDARINLGRVTGWIDDVVLTAG